MQGCRLQGRRVSQYLHTGMQVWIPQCYYQTVLHFAHRLGGGEGGRGGGGGGRLSVLANRTALLQHSPDPKLSTLRPSAAWQLTFNGVRYFSSSSSLPVLSVG